MGLSGKMRAGKTFTAQAVCDRRGFVRMSFAEPLKRDVVAMGFSEVEVYFTKPPAIRALLQSYGQARRHQDPDHWLRRVDSATRLTKPGTVFVIDDVRFPNEADWIRSEGGVMVRVEREGYEHTDTDVSETALDGYWFDYTISAGTNEVHTLVAQLEDILHVEGILHD